MSSVTKVPAGWRARWRTPDGKSRSKTFERKVDAQRQLTGTDHSKLTGVYVDPAAGRVTVREWSATWAASQPDWRPSTEVRVQSILTHHVIPAFGDRTLASVRPSEVKSFVKQLQESLAPNTVRAIYQVLSGFYRAAVNDSIVGKSPCSDVKLRPATSR